MRAMIRMGALVVVAALVVAGCSSQGDGENVSPETTRIGVIAPLSGPSAASGKVILNSVALAVSQANDAQRLGEVVVEVTERDSGSDPDRGADGARALAGDGSVTAVVGTFLSPVAARTLPVLEEANMAQVSPANTSVSLTHASENNQIVRPFNNFFQVATPTDVEGSLDARYAAQNLQAKSVAVINDGTNYGANLSDSFDSTFVEHGTVARTVDISEDGSDAAEVVKKTSADPVDLIFYGGEITAGLELLEALAAAGVKTQVMGGGGLFSDQVGPLKPIGKVFTSVPGVNPQQAESARDYLDAYEAAGYEEPATTYGAYAYDAANLIIDALVATQTDNVALDSDARQGVLDRIQMADTSGASGLISFDEFGANTNNAVTVYEIDNGDWVVRDQVG